MNFDEMTMEQLAELRREWTNEVDSLRANLRLLVSEISKRMALEEAERKAAGMSELQKDAMRQVVRATGIPSEGQVGAPQKKKWWERLLG